MKRIGVIFNPVARGEKAQNFRHQLEQVRGSCSLKPTSGPGAAKELAMDLVKEGYDIIVAAGGDGTINEVINGIGQDSKGFDQVTFGIIPLGTANVFAIEHGIPHNFPAAWNAIHNGKTRLIDIPCLQCESSGMSRYFVQMAGVGYDALAVKAVHWSLKKKIGFLAYGLSAFVTALHQKPRFSIFEKTEWGDQEWIIVSNGRFYAGKYPFFPEAKPDDNLLDICGFNKVNVFVLAWSFISLLFLGRLPSRFIRRFQASKLSIRGTGSVPLELDGENIENIANALHFRLMPKKLNVLLP
jgi:YegS/Rv2252/BmrU family lipid kinase